MQIQFTALNNEIIAFVERCPAALWRTPCANDGRTVAVVAHHIASSHEPVLQLVQMVANAQPLPTLSYDMFDLWRRPDPARHLSADRAILV